MGIDDSANAAELPSEKTTDSTEWSSKRPSSSFFRPPSYERRVENRRSSAVWNRRGTTGFFILEWSTRTARRHRDLNHQQRRKRSFERNGTRIRLTSERRSSFSTLGVVLSDFRVKERPSTPFVVYEGNRVRDTGTRDRASASLTPNPTFGSPLGVLDSFGSSRMSLTASDE